MALPVASSLTDQMPERSFPLFYALLAGPALIHQLVSTLKLDDAPRSLRSSRPGDRARPQPHFFHASATVRNSIAREFRSLSPRVGCDLQPIAAYVHAAPASGAFLAGVVEMQDAILALAKSRLVGQRQERRNAVHDGTENVQRHLGLEPLSTNEARTGLGD